jgi:AcrR family transcriptional regulator
MRKTRAILRQSLTTLLREKSVKEITVKELTTLADINRGTFYRHYRDIYNMMEQLENELFDEFRSMLDVYTASELKKGLGPILRDIFRFIGRNLDLSSALLDSGGNTLFLDRLKAAVYDKVFREWAGLYEFENEKRLSLVLSFVVGGVIGLLRDWMGEGCHQSAVEMASLSEQLILFGIKPMEHCWDSR